MTNFEKITQSPKALAEYLAEQNCCLFGKRWCSLEKYCHKCIQTKKEQGTYDGCNCSEIFESWLNEVAE